MRRQRTFVAAALGILCAFLLAADPTEDSLVLVSQAPGSGAPVWHPEGGLAALGGPSGLGIWDVDSGRALARIAPDHRIGAMGWTRGGEGIVGALSRVGGIHEWDVRAGALIQTLRSPQRRGAGTRIEVSGGGSSLLIRGPRQTSLHDVHDGAELFRVGDHVLEVSPDGRRAVVRFLRDHQLVDGRTGEVLAILGEPAPPYGTPSEGWRPRSSHTLVAWSIDAEVVALWPKSRHKAVAERIELFDGSTGEPLGELTFEPQELYGVAFGPDDRTLVAWNDERVDLWDLGGGTREALIEDGDVQDVAWSPDRSTLAVLRTRYQIPGPALAEGEEDPTRIELWRPGEGAPDVLPGAGVCAPGFGGLSWSPDGGFLVRWGQSSEMVVWDVAARRVHRAQGGAGWSVHESRFSPDGGRVAAVVDRDQVHVWDLARGTLQGVFDNDGHPVFSLAWSADGRWLAVGAERVSIWDPARDRIKHELDLELPPADLDTRTYGGEMYVAARLLAWSPDGRTLATARQYGMNVALWDVRSGELRRVLGPGSEEDPAAAPRGPVSGLNGMSFSPDGRYLATTEQRKRALIWEMDAAADGEEALPVAVAALDGIGLDTLWIDEEQLAIRDGGHSIHVMDAAARTTLRSLPVHDRSIDSMARAPEGDALLFVDRPRKEARPPAVLRMDLELGATNLVGSLPEWGRDPAIHPDGDLIAYGAEGLALHRLSTGATIHLRATRVDGDWASIAWTPDGRFDGNARLFDELLYADPYGDLLERPLIPGSQVADRFHESGLYRAEGFGVEAETP